MDFISSSFTLTTDFINTMHKKKSMKTTSPEIADDDLVSESLVAFLLLFGVLNDQTSMTTGRMAE